MIAVGMAIVSAVLAGPLDPPAGPIAPTPGPEPRIAINQTNTPGDSGALFIITAPGSYYLEGNVTGEASKRGIEIAADHVTIDLMGYTCDGVVGSDEGVWSLGTRTGIEVRNGVVTNWSQGIKVGQAIIRDVRAENNIVTGIDVSAGSLVVDCTATNNGTGIRTGHGCRIARCVVSSNTAIGISAFHAANVTDCTAYDNEGTGIFCQTGSIVTGCVSRENNGSGFFVGASSMVSECTAYSNSGFGIQVGSESTVSNCTASTNGTDGIRVFGGCLVKDNTCTDNGQDPAGGAGIRVTALGGNCRFEGNHCLNNDIGIDVDSTGNVIIRNTCSGNTTNWAIVAGNAYGPIVLVQSAAAVNGDTASASVNSNHAWANFTLP